MTQKKTKAGLEDIAREAGVSKMTVSRVLRNGSGFSEETRNRVTATAERLGYFPNRLAAAFGSARASTLVGVCVPRFTSSLFGQMLESINATFARLGYQTMISCRKKKKLGCAVSPLGGLRAWCWRGVATAPARCNSCVI